MNLTTTGSGESHQKSERQKAGEIPVIAEYDQPAQAKRHEAAWARIETKLKSPVFPESDPPR